ncbi:MAG: NAD(P)H-hydrate epimerase [Candidatus Aenigmarchaeota archaeon]|nr:NAD(P)H-hydrate epimerase [Candidatus Aenigmarchaeota archaeon]
MMSLTTDEMRAVDEKAEKHFGIELPQMLENAGRNAAFFARESIGGVKKKNILVLCGKGNKAASGLVAARFLHNWGAKVTVIAADHPDNLKKWTKWHIGTLKSMYVDVLYPTNQFAFADTFKKCDVIIDALVGYGINRPPTGFYESLIIMANESGKKVLSIDMPSGMNPDTGEPNGACIKAKWTMSIAAPKRGLMEKKAKEYTGALYLCDIGIPPEVYELLGMKYENPFDRNEIVKL